MAGAGGHGSFLPCFVRLRGEERRLDRPGWQSSKWTREFDHAPDGNIALTGELDLTGTREFTLGLAFGNSQHHAVSTLFQSLSTRPRGRQQTVRGTVHAGAPAQRCTLPVPWISLYRNPSPRALRLSRAAQIPRRAGRVTAHGFAMAASASPTVRLLASARRWPPSAGTPPADARDHPPR